MQTMERAFAYQQAREARRTARRQQGDEQEALGRRVHGGARKHALPAQQLRGKRLAATARALHAERQEGKCLGN